jgi:hypothetical protein
LRGMEKRAGVYLIVCSENKTYYREYE